MKISKKTKLIALAAVIVVLIIATVSVYATVSSKRIYDGVYVGKTHLGGMTQKQAEEALSKYISQRKDMTLNFECDGRTVSVEAADISLGMDVKKASKDAYSAGRGKKIFKNYKNIISYKFKDYTIPVVFSYDKDRLLLTIKDSVQDKITDPVPMTVEIGKDRLYVKNAVSGRVIDEEKLFKNVNNAFENLSNDVIDISVVTKTPENLGIDDFYKEYNREAKDAVYTKTDDSFVIEPEIIGISFDKAEAKEILEENKDNTEVYEIPAVITNPEVTSKMLEDKYVNKIIATYSTSLGDSTANRIANIALAASKIDGYVINPGKRFSYNAVVGPRTAATGFKMAHVYVGNQVVDGIGGGICQVSSTLYNAVVMADLKIVSRTNHSLPVSYVPLGRDATVSYGTIDFVFENDKSYPISIKAGVEGSTLTVSVVGTSDMDYTVEFVSAATASIRFSTVEVEDPAMNEGETKVLSNGANGYTASSYRVYKKDGKEYSRTFEAKSTYASTPEKVAVGTKKAETNEEKSEKTVNTEDTPSPETSGNETPDNTEPVIPSQPEEADVEVLVPENSSENTDDPLLIE